jgi:RNA polymerase sigma-70 factor (ECF subfamily)
MMSERGTTAQTSTAREQELVDSLLSFDAAAWKQLFEANYQRVYRYAYVRLGNAADAEDVAAGVFSEAVRGIGSFQYRGIPVAAWLFRIAHHETVDVLKRRRLAPQAGAEEVGAEHSELTRTIDRLDLGEALDDLKAEHREVLLLRFIEDRSVRDTAEILGKSEGAVKVLQLRALRSLRTRIGGANDDRSARAS